MEDNRQPPRSIAGDSMLAAAMLAVGKILEPDKTRVEIQIEVPSEPVDLLGDLGVDFGDLPDL